MKTRKILSSVLAGILSLSALTGCAGTDSTSSSPETTPAQKNETAAAAEKTDGTTADTSCSRSRKKPKLSKKSRFYAKLWETHAKYK